MNSPCFRLRFRKRELFFVPGTYLIGRSAKCDLRIDDTLVSRRHAELLVRSDSEATIRDCGSANGVFVDGARLPPHETAALRPGTRVVIGKEVIEVHRPSIPPPHRAKMNTEKDDAPPSSDGAEATQLTPLAELASLGEMEPADGARPGTDARGGIHTAVTSRTDALEMYAPVARSALAMGRSEDAEALMGTHLQAVLSRVQAGQEVSAESVNRAAEVAVDLARAGRAGWFDFVVTLYELRRDIPPAHVVSGMERALEHDTQVDPRALSLWVQALRGAMDAVALDQLPTIDRLESMLGKAIRKRR